ncbi:MAG TPA: response regulator transcription factor [Terriglobales bacterium]
MDSVLVIDDDVELCALIRDFLEPLGFKVDAIHDGYCGLERAKSCDASIIVLDVMLPRMNGLDVLRELRRVSSIPVLLLTARGADVDRILGLELGADDYLPKPFNARELVARIRAILRRSMGAESMLPRLQLGDLEVDLGRRTATRSGRKIGLTGVEFNLLTTLVKNAGKVVTRDDLSREVLGRTTSPYDRSIDVHVSRVRKKLCADSVADDMIKTRRGVGYVYTLPPPTEIH